MQHHLLTRIHLQFLHKCIRVSLSDISFCSFNQVLTASFVTASIAITVTVAVLALGEALTVELQATRP